MTPCIWITRPQPGAIQTATLLGEAGYDTHIFSVLNIEPMEKKLPKEIKDTIGDIQAIAFTSKHAVDSATSLPDFAALPAFTVGEATAQKAREAGFTQVVACEGNAHALQENLMRHCHPSHGRILYLRGQDVYTHLSPALEQQGYEVSERIVYKAVAAPELSPELIAELRQGKIHAVTAYSARSLNIVESLIHHHALENASRAMHLICLSAPIARGATSGLWHKVVHATAPHQTAMLKVFKRLYGEPPRITT